MKRAIVCCLFVIACTDQAGEETGLFFPEEVTIASSSIFSDVTPTTAIIVGQSGATSEPGTVTAENLESGQRVSATITLEGSFALILETNRGDFIRLTHSGNETPLDIATANNSVALPLPVAGGQAGVTSYVEDDGSEKIQLQLSVDLTDKRFHYANLRDGSYAELTQTAPGEMEWTAPVEAEVGDPILFYPEFTGLAYESVYPEPMQLAR